MKENCRNCRFYYREQETHIEESNTPYHEKKGKHFSIEDVEYESLCRRLPPVRIYLTEDGNINRSGDKDGFNTLYEYPWVLGSDWCGEWEF